MNPSMEEDFSDESTAKRSSPWWTSPFWEARILEENTRIGLQMNPSREDAAKGSSPWLMSPEWEETARILEEDARISQEWRSRELEELMPDLPRDEQLRLQNRFREHDRNRRRRNKKSPPPWPSSFYSTRNEQDRESGMISLVRDALRHYNARHPGGEFDPVKPLMESRVLFRGHTWFHINFWACSRTNSKLIKRFFAEIHHKSFSTLLEDCSSDRQKHKDSDPQKLLKNLFPIVETCTIIEEPLCQYKRSCGFCLANFDIFHPKGCSKFVCGNDKDRIGQLLEKPRCCGNAI